MEILIETQKVPIYMTPEETKLFIEFQKRYAFVKLMESINAFDVKSGSVTIHFNNLGEIASVDKQQHYRLQK